MHLWMPVTASTHAGSAAIAFHPGSASIAVHARTLLIEASIIPAHVTTVGAWIISRSPLHPSVVVSVVHMLSAAVSTDQTVIAVATSIGLIAVRYKPVPVIRVRSIRPVSVRSGTPWVIAVVVGSVVDVSRVVNVGVVLIKHRTSASAPTPGTAPSMETPTKAPAYSNNSEAAAAKC